LPLLSAWVSLLRAFAQPEVYGASLAPADGGLYRMWRELEIDVLESRGTLGDATANEPAFVEVVVDSVLSARTSGQRSRIWHERFSLSELPPTRRTELRVCVARKGVSCTMGRVELDMGSLRRGEAMESWHPIIMPGTGLEQDKGQVPELRIRIRLDEEIILPQASYAYLLEVSIAPTTLSYGAHHLVDTYLP
jgi:hypothetical protein